MEVEHLRSRLREASGAVLTGRVTSVSGLAIRFVMPGVRIGDVVHVKRRGGILPCEVVGFSGGEAVGLPMGILRGVGPDDEVESTGDGLTVCVGEALLGRVVDGTGTARDGGPPIEGGRLVSVDRAAPDPMTRRRIDSAFTTGIRCVDGLLTLGLGQRIGLFAGSGVGKSTLLGALARGAAADVVVVALVGERGREVSEFLDGALGDEGKARSVVVVATSDSPPVERMRAAEVATAYAEYFRDSGKNVLLLVDSVTRYARAAREVGLSAGEPPTRRGYPPSVFAMLPRLLERAGQGSCGSITAIYTVLVEGGDMDEPVADEVRGILDGHIVLDRELAIRGRFPAIDPLASLSRLMPSVTEKAHRDVAARLRELIGVYEAKRDLVLLGAYKSGSDAVLDIALARIDRIEGFLRQDPGEFSPMASTLHSLRAILA